MGVNLYVIQQKQKGKVAGKTNKLTTKHAKKKNETKQCITKQKNRTKQNKTR